MRALYAEAATLVQQMGEGAVIVAKSAGAVSQMNAPALVETMSGIVNNHPTGLEQLWWRLFRRELHFLISSRGHAVNLTNALPCVSLTSGTSAPPAPGRAPLQTVTPSSGGSATTNCTFTNDRYVRVANKIATWPELSAVAAESNSVA